MRSLIKLTVTFLLVFVFLMPAPAAGAERKNPTVLLREGIYVEQTEGDIDRAIEIYTEVLDQAAEVHRLAARACYQLGMCYLKRGEDEAAVEYFKKVLTQYPDQKSVMKMAKIQLEQLAPEDMGDGESLYHKLPVDVINYIGAEYGAISARAGGVDYLYSNSHIYYVDSDFVLRKGGMGYYFNQTGRPVEGRIRLSGTTNADMVYYDVNGRQMDIDIVPDESREGYYHIYWFAETPIATGQWYSYGWCDDNVSPLTSVSEQEFHLKMQNKFGSKCRETFFLVLPEDIKVAHSTDDIDSHKRIDNFDVYYFSDVVPANTNHQVEVRLKYDDTDITAANPKVIDTVPENFDNAVDPLLAEIKVTFNQEMFPYGWSWVRSMYPFPQSTGSPYYDEQQKTCTMPVKMEPGKAYMVRINAEQYEAFRNPMKMPAQYYALVFATKDKMGRATEIPQEMIDMAEEINSRNYPTPYTQQQYVEILPDGLMQFKITMTAENTGSGPMKTYSFQNGDMVEVEKMFDSLGRELDFDTTHQHGHYRYKIRLNEPVEPGETYSITSVGTISGLVKRSAIEEDVWDYYMKHYPSSGKPTHRIEHYVLPEGAKLISTTPPGLKTETKDGRVNIFVDEMIEAGSSITVAFSYKLTGSGEATPDLIDAPWQNGEHMRLRLVTPSGMEIGETVYKVTTFEQDGQKLDRVESWLTVSSANMNQYTAVEAEHDSFAPLRGMTINNAGEFISVYEPGRVTLTTVNKGNEKTQVIETPGLVFDNEQAMYLIRRLPFGGDRSLFNFEIFPPQSSAVSTCRIKVLDIEDVTVPLGTFECYKLRLNVVHDGMNALEHKLWITTDDSRTLVKYDAGQAVMELTELEVLDPAMPVVVEDEKFSLKLPADWQYLAGDVRLYDVWIALMPPRLDIWAVLAGKGLDGQVESARLIAEMDAETLKGFFKDYTIDEQSWDESPVGGNPAASYTASYIEDGKEMIEYRTYIKARGMVYWFVFREQAEDFAGIKPTLESIAAGFEVK